MTGPELGECCRCGWRLYHLRRGTCGWCVSDVEGGGGEVEYANHARWARGETPRSALLTARRLAACQQWHGAAG